MLLEKLVQLLNKEKNTSVAIFDLLRSKGDFFRTTQTCFYFLHLFVPVSPLPVDVIFQLF